MRTRTTLLAISLLALPMLGSCELSKSELDVKKISRSVAYSLPVFHLNQLPMDTHISTNAFNLFIGLLDPAHSYFLQSDIDGFKEDSKTLHKRLRKGDIGFARNVFDILMERIDNRMAFAEEQLAKGFDLEKDEVFLWDRKEAPWPKDETEWNDLWRKRLKNEYIARLVSKEVYADDETETNTVATAETNEVVSAETVTTNAVADTDVEYDEAAEEANLSPEEFILKRYKQFKLTMESFDEEMLLQRYLSSFSQVYDPHSDYMSPSSVEDFDINMKLSLVGIGAMLRPDDGTAKIVRVIPGGPAERDGRLKAGDKIIAVSQGDEAPVSILHWPLYKAVRLIRGEKDTTVVLTVIPASDRSGTRTKKIDLVRDEVKLEEQAAKNEVRTFELKDGKERKFGIITLPDFYADFQATSKHQKDARRASTDVRRLINELIIEGIDGMVLDLRNNGGGSLVEAIETAGLFIASGPIVQVKERNGIQVLPDADPEVDYDGPMIVLVNRLSASASEILAAALQDYKRAIIVGDKQTHGKGTVQTLMTLGNRKGSLKLTTAGFYRINGGSTQLKGVTPDIIIPSYLDVMDVGEDSLEHALPWDTIHPAMYRTHASLSKMVPMLADQSRERIENDEEFQLFLNKRDRLKERFDTKSVSLSMENRLAEAEAEKELDDIQSGAFLDEEEEEEAKDIILDETLNILSDLIEFETMGNQAELLAPNLSSHETP
ncbi:MAG: carboxy terminal-processing peptidase [Verrucomicrobiota bacterium]|nr:carboxy terminal-processing peptidase [Verrucomicrobiota bacterium]